MLPREPCACMQHGVLWAFSNNPRPLALRMKCLTVRPANAEWWHHCTYRVWYSCATTNLSHCSILGVRITQPSLPSWVLTTRQASRSRNVAVSLGQGKRRSTFAWTKPRVCVHRVFQHYRTIDCRNACECLVRTICINLDGALGRRAQRACKSRTTSGARMRFRLQWR